jgi:hypothetical protein
VLPLLPACFSEGRVVDIDRPAICDAGHTILPKARRSGNTAEVEYHGHCRADGDRYPLEYF